MWSAEDRRSVWLNQAFSPECFGARPNEEAHTRGAAGIANMNADRAAHEWAWKQEFANPLRPSTADELRWYFAQRRGRHSAAHDGHERDFKRYAQARRAFSAPRYRVLYRAWLREGARVIDATSSPALADAITSGAGRFESHVLARPYLQLSSLVGTS